MISCVPDPGWALVLWNVWHLHHWLRAGTEEGKSTTLKLWISCTYMYEVIICFRHLRLKVTSTWVWWPTRCRFGPGLPWWMQLARIFTMTFMIRTPILSELLSLTSTCVEPAAPSPSLLDTRQPPDWTLTPLFPLVMQQLDVVLCLYLSYIPE